MLGFTILLIAILGAMFAIVVELERRHRLDAVRQEAERRARNIPDWDWPTW